MYRTHSPLRIHASYYLNQFHHQTDGWFSKESADVYETSTETLFLGRQDSMQRRTLVSEGLGFRARGSRLPRPNLNYKVGIQRSISSFATYEPSSPIVTHRPPLIVAQVPLSKLPVKPSSILEVACGTGRVGTFTRDLFPEAEFTLSDLSPFYLDKSRKNDAYWRQRYAGTNGGAEPPAARLVQANAEKLPFEVRGEGDGDGQGKGEDEGPSNPRPTTSSSYHPTTCLPGRFV